MVLGTIMVSRQQPLFGLKSALITKDAQKGMALRQMRQIKPHVRQKQLLLG
jgi:hypothetical protein